MSATPDVPFYPNYYEPNMGKLSNIDLNKRYTENLDNDPRPWWYEAKQCPHHKPRNIKLTSIERLKWVDGDARTGRHFRV